jgi:hypothetical protein
MAAAKEKEKKRSLFTIKTGTSSRHIKKLKKSIFIRCLWTRHSCKSLVSSDTVVEHLAIGLEVAGSNPATPRQHAKMVDGRSLRQSHFI